MRAPWLHKGIWQLSKTVRVSIHCLNEWASLYINVKMQRLEFAFHPMRWKWEKEVCASGWTTWRRGPFWIAIKKSIQEPNVWQAPETR